MSYNSTPKKKTRKFQGFYKKVESFTVETTSSESSIIPEGVQNNNDKIEDTSRREENRIVEGNLAEEVIVQQEAEEVIVQQEAEEVIVQQEAGEVIIQQEAEAVIEQQKAEAIIEQQKAENSPKSTQQQQHIQQNINVEQLSPSKDTVNQQVLYTSFTITDTEREVLNYIKLRSGKLISKVNRKNRQVQVDLSKEFGEELDKILSINMAPLDLNIINQLLNNIPTLYGESTPDVGDEVNVFLKCCDRVINCLKEESDKTTFLQILPTKFRGRAAKVLDGIGCDTYEQLKVAIYNKLVNNKSYFLQLNELRSCRQLPGESVKIFGNKILNLLESCKAKVEEKYTEGNKAVKKDLEETALFTFKSGLLNPTYRLLAFNDTETELKKAIEKIETLEENERQMTILQTPQMFNNSSNLLTNTPFSSINSNFTPQNYQNFNDQFQSNSNFFNPNFNSNTDFNYPNFTSKNHYNSQFPFNKNQNFRGNKQHSKMINTTNVGRPFNQQYNRNNYNQNNYQRNFPKICNFCGKNNHSFEECRIRKNTPFCINCKTYGHVTQYCNTQNKQNFPNRNNTSNSNINKQENRNSSNNSVKSNHSKCEFCRRLGHNIQNCHAKRLWESKDDKKQSKN